MTAGSALQEPAHALTGHVLPGGWKVESKIVKPQGNTGGQFSVQYIVKDKNNNSAFLKAINISKTLINSDPKFDVATELQQQTEIFNFERILLEVCSKAGLDRVVTAIGSGTIFAGEIPNTLPHPVFYLLFELADGDAQEEACLQKRGTLQQTLRTLHNVSVAIKQLHREDIAHQDLKPSNVLHFSDLTDQTSPSIKIAKIADLGRSEQKGRPLPTKYNNSLFLGDRTYAPPEFLYLHKENDWNALRLSSDLYMLGNLIYYCFTGVSLTVSIMDNLPPSLKRHPRGTFQGSFAEALPYLRDAFGQAIDTFKASLPTDRLAGAKADGRKSKAGDELILMIRYLCDPNPLLRGHPKDRPGNPWNIERFISALDRLAKSATSPHFS